MTSRKAPSTSGRTPASPPPASGLIFMGLRRRRRGGPMEKTFPTLTPPQLARIESGGRRRAVAAGEVLVAVGDPNIHFFVVVRGRVDVIRGPRAKDRQQPLIVS